MRGLFAGTISAALLLWVGTAGAASIKDIGRDSSTARAREARDYLLHGKPGQVLALFGIDAGAARALDRKLVLKVGTLKAPDKATLARALGRIGRFSAARGLLRGCHEAVCARAAKRIERLSGTRKGLLRRLTRALKRHPGDVVLRLALGRALRDIGRRHAARRLLDPLADLYQDGKLKELDELVAVADSLALNGYFKDANTVMAEASEGATGPAERKLVELHWGLLFLSKYNFRDADLALDKVLRIDPYQPEATVAMARIDLESDNDVRAARKRLDQLLRRQPRQVGALCMRAEVALRDEDYRAARRFVDRALAIRPDSREALHVLAAVARSMDDNRSFARAARRALSLDPIDGGLYVKTARYLELGHRYPEVLQLLRKALDKDPELWTAHAMLGVAYSRIADDERARRQLETAFDNDPYNVRTANILNVLYDGVLKQMQVLHGEHVDLRVHRRTRKALERTVLPFLQRSYERLSRRYKMKAPKPLRVEIFPTTEQFSVRTVGLPRLGAHAVCFGHLITSRSPAERPFNWKMVLHHEMSHVFHIRATGGRVPRWLTEGVAMMESVWMDPSWQIISERRAWDRLQAGKLAKIDSFNLAFSQARSMRAIVDAYYQAMLLVRFLEQRWGFDKLRRLIVGHGPGGSTGALIRRIYGMPPSRIDSLFAAWLAHELGRFRHDFRPGVGEIKRRLVRDWTGGDEATVALSEAVTAIEQGKSKLAYAALHKAAFTPHTRGTLARAPRVREAESLPMCAVQYLLMGMELSGHDRRAAEQLAASLVASGTHRCDGVVQRIVLARASRRKSDRDAMNRHFRRAHELDPRDASVLELWLKTTPKGRAGRRRELARKIIALDPNDVAAPRSLAELAWARLRDDRGIPRVAAGAGWTTRAAPHKAATRLDAPAGKAWLADLTRAQTRLEEVVPTTFVSVLFEARLATLRGRLKWAMPIYREAARRAATAGRRAVAWCELKWVAEQAGAGPDAAEAGRRCRAARSEN